MTELLLAATAIAVYALWSQRLNGWAVSAPMFFTVVGVAIGPGGLDVFDLSWDNELVSVVLETTLVLVLFSDAASIDVRRLRRNAWLPFRLLVIGLPLTVLTGSLVALAVLPGLVVAEAILLAAVVTPTDAALGQAVVTDGRLPARLRDGLSIESGLNDGIMVPAIVVLLLSAQGEALSRGAGLRLAAEQIGFGVMVGMVVGYLGGRLFHSRSEAGLIAGIWRQIGLLALPASAYAGSVLAGGNGFIAAFVAGLTFGAVSCAECREIADFTEDEGQLLASLSFLIFGAVFVDDAARALDWRAVVFAVLALTVMRMVPVFISLTGSKMLVESKFFAGWFGPRGLASVLFMLLVADEGDHIAGADTIVAAATVTVFVSVIAHGLTAPGWSRRLSRKLANRGGAEGRPMIR